MAGRKKQANLAWCFFALAWSFSLYDITKSLISYFGGWSGHLLASDVQRTLYAIYLLGIGLPVSLSFPAVLLSIKASKGSRSPARKFFVLCAIIGFADLTAMIVWITFLIEQSYLPF